MAKYNGGAAPSAHLLPPLCGGLSEAGSRWSHSLLRESVISLYAEYSRLESLKLNVCIWQQPDTSGTQTPAEKCIKLPF